MKLLSQQAEQLVQAGHFESQTIEKKNKEVDDRSAKCYSVHRGNYHMIL